MTRRQGLGRAVLAVAALAVAGSVTGSVLTAPAASAAGTRATAATATVTTRSVVGKYTPPKRTLSVGSRGADVKALQQRLSALKYYPGSIDGVYGGDTQAAIWAFQEINGISVTGTVGPVTGKALVKPKTYKSPSYAGKRATRIEVSQHLEVLVYFLNGKIWFISHVSSGGGYLYNCGAAGCSRATTPNGTYNTTVYMPGWVHVPLGEMYNPVFFISTVFAVHGDTYVPKGPASHGCVRIPMSAAAFFHKMVKTPGTQVHVYGTPQWQK
jgi:peptidoglycan hydrolase-like protein with peptidoglycan-binding domain